MLVLLQQKRIFFLSQNDGYTHTAKEYSTKARTFDRSRVQGRGSKPKGVGEGVLFSSKNHFLYGKIF